MCKVIF